MACAQTCEFLDHTIVLSTVLIPQNVRFGFGSVLATTTRVQYELFSSFCIWFIVRRGSSNSSTWNPFWPGSTVHTSPCTASVRLLSVPGSSKCQKVISTCWCSIFEAGLLLGWWRCDKTERWRLWWAYSVYLWFPFLRESFCSSTTL